MTFDIEKLIDAFQNDLTSATALTFVFWCIIADSLRKFVKEPLNKKPPVAFVISILVCAAQIAFSQFKLVRPSSDFLKLFFN